MAFKSVEFPLWTRILSNLFVSSFIDRCPKANTTIPRRKRVINIWEYYRISDKFSSVRVEMWMKHHSVAYIAMEIIRRSNFSFHSSKRAEHISNELPQQMIRFLQSLHKILQPVLLSRATVKYKSLTRIEWYTFSRYTETSQQTKRL